MGVLEEPPILVSCPRVHFSSENASPSDGSSRTCMATSNNASLSITGDYNSTADVTEPRSTVVKAGVGLLVALGWAAGGGGGWRGCWARRSRLLGGGWVVDALFGGVRQVPAAGG